MPKSSHIYRVSEVNFPDRQFVQLGQIFERVNHVLVL